jgi:hypothetical protein
MNFVVLNKESEFVKTIFFRSMQEYLMTSMADLFSFQLLMLQQEN